MNVKNARAGNRNVTSRPLDRATTDDPFRFPVSSYIVSRVQTELLRQISGVDDWSGGYSVLGRELVIFITEVDTR